MSFFNEVVGLKPLQEIRLLFSRLDYPLGKEYIKPKLTTLFFFCSLLILLLEECLHYILLLHMMQEGFQYHHAEPGYLMLVNWLPVSAPRLPVNASHRVGIGALVVNHDQEVLFFPH